MSFLRRFPTTAHVILGRICGWNMAGQDTLLFYLKRWWFDDALEFCGIRQPGWFACSPPAQYLIGALNSAGVTRDYLKAVYNGTSKNLNANMKKHLPKPIDELKIADYYESRKKAECASASCDALAVPTNLERSRKFFGVAMARQVVAFIGNREDNIDCIAVDAYKKAVVNEAAARYEISRHLHEGADLRVEQHSKCHAAGCYQKIVHKWSIQNCGRCLWSGRKLAYVLPRLK